MGLCKCPKRQVTNQFCFEHRVNVCEYCMVLNHPKCIVQSYLQWLRDSDYVSTCTLCSTSLEDGECVRLVCYHVFHWDCLNARQSALPANTAPRGHVCPICETEIFPVSNLVSPVAEALKNFLSTVNWGRTGLGLALLPEEQIITAKPKQPLQSPATASISSMNRVLYSGSGMTNLNPNNPHSVLLMDAFNLPADNNINASSRRPLLSRQSPIGGTDRDENKYKRRTPAEVFSRWSRRMYAPSSRPPWRRTWFLVFSGILSFVAVIYLMAALGRGRNNDALDEGWNNPNPIPNNHYD